jgi:prepilin-type N-terminal cleavage/methylation domain-containing protein
MMPNSPLKTHPFRRAFTVLEMLVVITIIGFLAALALPHLPGMTQANSMTAAVQQLLSDCALARQLAMSHRSPVYMVFVPPYSSWNPMPPVNDLGSYDNLLSHQYGAYALISLRTVGDQPGRANPQYLTEWKTLPNGVFIAPWKFAGPVQVVRATNTLAGTFGTFTNYPFPRDLYFPFPAPDATNIAGYIYSIRLPYIGFSPLGQLITNGDEYIPLDRGRVLNSTNTATATSYNLTNAATAICIEAPPGNAVNNCNLIHLDWLTARAKIERNQQR